MGKEQDSCLSDTPTFPSFPAMAIAARTPSGGERLPMATARSSLWAGAGGFIGDEVSEEGRNAKRWRKRREME